MQPKDKYRAISCDYYDLLEIAALKANIVNIEFTQYGDSQKVESRITDIRTIEGEEFVFLENKIRIRLDKITRMDGISFDKSDCNTAFGKL